MTPEEAKERKIMKLLLKVKNGTPPMRKQALRQITDNARAYGAESMFNQNRYLLYNLNSSVSCLPRFFGLANCF